MWIKNSNGRKDAILTFLTLTFAAVLLRYVAGGLTFWDFAFPVFESTPAVVLLGLLLPAYIARRHGIGNKDAASAT